MISTSNSSRKSSGELSFKAKYKTEICKFWELNKTCKFGESCAFAHGNNEIRQKTVFSNSYKTKRCKQFFECGYCLYGSRCQFLHHEKNINCYSFKLLLKNYDPANEKSQAKRLRIFGDIYKVVPSSILSKETFAKENGKLLYGYEGK